MPGPLVPMLSLPEGGLCVTLGNEPAPLNLFPLWEKGVLFPWTCWVHRDHVRLWRSGLAH